MLQKIVQEACRMRLKRPIRMYQNLGVTLHPLIKLLIGSRSLVKPNFVRDHETRLGLARYDQVPQIPVVLLDVTLAGPDGQTLSQVRNADRVGATCDGQCDQREWYLPSQRACRNSLS